MRRKNKIAATVGCGCFLGAAVAETAATEDLTRAYGVFNEEAHNVNPHYTPQTVNTDSWKSTQASWKVLFPFVVVLQCLLHAWLKIRNRAKHLKNKFSDEFGERTMVFDSEHEATKYAEEELNFDWKVVRLEDD